MDAWSDDEQQEKTLNVCSSFKQRFEKQAKKCKQLHKKQGSDSLSMFEIQAQSWGNFTEMTG